MSELREVWLVIRRYDEDSDYVGEAVVATYPGEDEARQHAELANEAISKDDSPEKWENFKSPYDPSLVHISSWSSIFYSYHVEKVPFALHVDQFLERVPE